MTCTHNLTGSERSVKIYQRAQMPAGAEKKFLNEVSVLKRLDHPNIVRLYEVYKDPKTYYLVEE